ncbi:MAG TPA: SRPBCC family protein [Puia sp.]|nr:SRPBCC family protein [Puia sp.]
MAVQILHRVQLIPAPLEKVWSFFTDPANLPRITPPDMQFVVLSPSQGDRIYTGELIEYKLRPLPWFRTRWLTEITQVEEGHYFVDEQRRGPYSLWHHQHHFRKIEGGVEMTDLVHYMVPFGPLGDLVNAFFVRRRLEDIFLYRRQVVESIFGSFPDYIGPLTMRAATTPRH